MADKPRKPMTVRQRRALLELHGLTPIKIARALNLTEGTVWVVLNRYPKKKSRRIQEYIAAHTGKTFEQIWGTEPSKIKANHPGNYSQHTMTIANKESACK